VTVDPLGVHEVAGEVGPAALGPGPFWEKIPRETFVPAEDFF